jgi:hypothetical protein
MPRRLRVVVPAFLAGLCLSMCCGGPVVANPAVWARPAHPSHPPVWLSALLVLFGPSAGPFAEPLAFVEYSWPRMLGLGAVLLGLIALHPWRPGIGTGVASGVGVAVWYLLGFANTYSGV